MDRVDQLIATHRERVREHRRALDDTSRVAGQPAEERRRDRTPPTARRAPVERDNVRLPTRAAAAPTAVDESPPQRGASAAYDAAPLSPSSSRYYTQTPTKVFERAKRWATQRDQQIRRQAEEKASAELVECTFRPRRESTSVRDGTRSASAEPLAGTPHAKASFLQHVQRNKAARRDRMEREKKAAPDGSSWTGAPTRPREFSFNNRDRATGIASLRKPVIPGSGPYDPTSDLLVEGADVSPRDNAAIPAARSERVAVAPQTARSAEALEQARAEAASLRQQLVGRDAEIAALAGTVAAMRRELEAAKAKIRQLALAQQVQERE